MKKNKELANHVSEEVVEVNEEFTSKMLDSKLIQIIALLGSVQSKDEKENLNKLRKVLNAVKYNMPEGYWVKEFDGGEIRKVFVEMSKNEKAMFEGLLMDMVSGLEEYFKSESRTVLND